MPTFRFRVVPTLPVVSCLGYKLQAGVVRSYQSRNHKDSIDHLRMNCGDVTRKDTKSNNGQAISLVSGPSRIGLFRFCLSMKYCFRTSGVSY